MRAITNNADILLVLPLLLLSSLVMAQQDETESSEELPGLNLFDDDVERTNDGWVQFYVALGITYLDANGKFSAILPGGKNVTIIDFDRVGLDKTDASYWLSLNWRSADSRWGAWFGSWEYDVSGYRQWETDLNIPDRDPIPAGAYVTTEFDAKWYILEALYSFHRSKTIDAGIGFGFHSVDIDTELTARIELGENEVEVVKQQLHALAPLPNVLAYVHWKFAPRWNLVSRLGYFSLNYDNYDGGMTNAHVLINYNLSPRWALSAGYQFVDIDLKIEKKKYIQKYEIDFSGPLAYLRFNF